MRTAKRALAVVCLLAFSLVAFAVPAAAETSFPGQPFPQIGALNSTNYQQGFHAYDSYYFSTNTDRDVVGFFVGNYEFYCVSTSSAAPVFAYYGSGSTRTVYLNGNHQATGLYYAQYAYGLNGATKYAPNFSSLDAGMSAAKLFFEYEMNPTDTQTYRFSVPAGWVAYIQLEDPAQDIDISATMFQNSALIGTNGSYWPSNATIRDGASYPSAGTQFPVSGAQTIRWFKDAGGSTNLLGQTKAARSTFQATSNLVEIYNPYHTGSTVGDSTEAATSWLAGDPNPNLTVTVTGLSPNGIRMYPLSDRMDVSADSDSFIVSGSNDDYTDYVESSNQPPENPDPENPQPVISWKTPGGDPTPAPTPGGENEPIQSASIADILNNFLNRFTSLFTEGFDAIRNLSENASQFVSRLSSLYAWLPPQILGVLTSAIILAIIVGVLKVFL